MAEVPAAVFLGMATLALKFCGKEVTLGLTFMLIIMSIAISIIIETRDLTSKEKIFTQITSVYNAAIYGIRVVFKLNS
jgi:hypothetical protein